jgi:small-conductance mechanosensitive channel
MVKDFRYKFTVLFCTAALFLALICLIGPQQLMAQEETTQPEKTESVQPDKTETAQAEKAENTQPEKDFPGINEIGSRATETVSRMAGAETQLHKAEDLAPVYETLDPLVAKIEELEARYTNWEQVTTWRVNRIRSAQANYLDLAEQQKVKLNVLYTRLQVLENLRSTWEKEKTYWLEWRKVLSTTDITFPAATFERTLAGIDKLLARITRVGGELIRAQQKYAPGQEIIARRLSTIDKTLGSMRRETFRRNSFSLVEPAYYRQFNRELFADFTSSLSTTLRWPKSYFKDHGWAAALQVIFILIITWLLISRRKKSKPIEENWRFLFQRPFAGAIFINIIIVGNFTYQYRNLPLSYKWMLLIITAVVIIRLINVGFLKPRERKAASIIAVAFIITESLQTFGIPEPFLQLYDVLFCAAAISLCWQFFSRRREEMPLHRFLVNLISGISVVCLATAMLGFERLASTLLIASVSTFFFLIVLGITLRLVSGGIESFMQLEWIRKRTFMQVLGLEEATRKLQTLSKIIILINAAFSLMVIWRLADSYQDGRDTILSYELTMGELTLTLNMVVMVIVILYLTMIISWMIQALVDSQIMTPKDMDRGIKESLKRLIHYGLFTFGFLVAVSMAGLDLQKFTILAGALGVGIGFGLQNIVNNFVSGLILLFERPVKVGDIININQDWGTITKIGLRSTVFETFDNSEVIVPNADLIAQKVTNWTFSSKTVRVVLPVGVEYGSPLEKVLEILNKAAKEHPEVLSEPQPNSIFEGFGTSSIDFQLRFWVKSIDDRLRLRTEVAVSIDRLFREEGIVIAFPQLDLHVRSVESDLQPLCGAKSPKIPADTEKPPEESV